MFLGATSAFLKWLPLFLLNIHLLFPSHKFDNPSGTHNHKALARDSCWIKYTFFKAFLEFWCHTFSLINLQFIPHPFPPRPYFVTCYLGRCGTLCVNHDASICRSGAEYLHLFLKFLARRFLSPLIFLSYCVGHRNAPDPCDWITHYQPK